MSYYKPITIQDIFDAADAIEQLAKRHDAAEETHRYQKCFSCQYIHVDMGEEPCLNCNQCWDGEEKCNWEQRGVSTSGTND